MLIQPAPASKPTATSANQATYKRLFSRLLPSARFSRVARVFHDGSFVQKIGLSDRQALLGTIKLTILPPDVNGVKGRCGTATHRGVVVTEAVFDSTTSNAKLA